MSLLTRTFCCAAPNQHILCQTQATEAVSRLLRQRESVFFCAQNIAEFWNVASRPADVNGLGMTTQEVLKEIAHIEALLTLLPDVPGVYPQWKRIVAHHNVQGVKVYDARLVALMNVYSIDHLLTFNVADFKRYSHISVLLPSALSFP